MPRPRKSKLDPLTGLPTATPEELRIAINRLGRKLVNETNQAECDRMEAELQQMEARFNAVSPPVKLKPPSGNVALDDSWLFVDPPQLSS